MPRLSKFASMSVTKLIELRDELDEHLGQRRKALETQMGQLENYIDGGRKVAGRRTPMAGVKVAPKYRGPKGETWAGRGVHPRWLAALLNEGHKIEEYAIGRVRFATANKKTAKKVGRKPAKRAKRKG